jgi:predicted transcriptional regulator YdeE
MQDYSHEECNFSGYKISTTNKDKQSAHDIMAAWTKWREGNLADKVQGKSNETLYCIYFNYQNAENPDERSYDLLIGFETISGVEQTDPEITTETIPAQNYKYDTVPRDDFPAFMAKWAEINSMSDLNRTYGFDMDIYGQDEITIAVAVE